MRGLHANEVVDLVDRRTRRGRQQRCGDAAGRFSPDSDPEGRQQEPDIRVGGVWAELALRVQQGTSKERQAEDRGRGRNGQPDRAVGISRAVEPERELDIDPRVRKLERRGCTIGDRAPRKRTRRRVDGQWITAAERVAIDAPRALAVDSVVEAGVSTFSSRGRRPSADPESRSVAGRSSGHVRAPSLRGPPEPCPVMERDGRAAARERCRRDAWRPTRTVIIRCRTTPVIASFEARRRATRSGRGGVLEQLTRLAHIGGLEALGERSKDRAEEGRRRGRIAGLDPQSGEPGRGPELRREGAELGCPVECVSIPRLGLGDIAAVIGRQDSDQVALRDP